MEKYFAKHFNGIPLETFSETHIIALISIAIINILLSAFLAFKRHRKEPTVFSRFILAVLLLLFEGSYTVWSLLVGDWSPGFSLPLHLCDAAIILAALMLFNKNYFMFEIVYFWGLGGSIQALVTPDLGPYSFPHFVFFNFFLSHGSIITSILYMIFAEGYRPVMKSIPKVFIFTNFYAACIAVINMITRGNYLFICSKPASPSLMDYLGPWPWYIISLEFVAAISFMICYLPYGIIDLHNKIKK